MDAKAKHRAAQCAPRKARLLRGLILGKSAAQALSLLSVERRAGSEATVKLIRSALAQIGGAAVATQAMVIDLVVDEGPKRRMFMPRAQGRATPILKRTSHLTVVLRAH
jgi:large subunit ribosomal protein L22